MNDPKNMENWMIRSYENGKVWNGIADMLNESHLDRQAFVAATYAAEEFTKSFLLWWYLVTEKNIRNMLNNHYMKQALAFVLAAGPYFDDFPEIVAELYNNPVEYIKDLKASGLSWEHERQSAIYEDKRKTEPNRFNIGYVGGISATLEERMSRLINDYVAGLSSDNVNETFIQAFGQSEDFFHKVGSVIESWQDIE